MRFTSQASSGGVLEQLFSLGEIPGVLWTPEGAGAPRPVIVMGHGGGHHKQAPDIANTSSTPGSRPPTRHARPPERNWLR
jgi:hypothetical protein